MDDYGHDFYDALVTTPQRRNDYQVRTIYRCLRRLDSFHNLKEDALRAVCQCARFERHSTHSILFRKGQIATCWYILLTGAVFMDRQMILPPGWFGKRTNHRFICRPCDCVVLEPSDMIVLDYPDVEHEAARSARKAVRSLHLNSNDHVDLFPSPTMTRSFVENRGGTWRRLKRRESIHSIGDDIFADLPESAVDSEDEDELSCPSYDSFHELKDGVRECLEKEPYQRTDDDLSILLDFMRHMPALSSLPMSVKRQLCLKMVFAIVPNAGTVVMRDKEPLDSWSVIVNGQVEVLDVDGRRTELGLGDSFGARPVSIPQLNTGQMRTLVDDCEFVLVEHADYCDIMAGVAEHLQRHSDLTGEVVCETERRTVSGHDGYVLVRAKQQKLVAHLVEERDCVVDPHYVEDFLLVYRTFLFDPVVLLEKLMLWFADPQLRDKVARIMLLWVNNHFNDFETNDDMLKLLERDGMMSQQVLLNIACSVKSKARTVSYSRSNRDEVLHFSILGGSPTHGIFVSKVEIGSQAEIVGLKRGDEILEVNGQNVQRCSHQRTLNLLRSCTHSCLLVKSNLLGFKEMLASCERTDIRKGRFIKNHRPLPPTLDRQTLSCIQMPGVHNRSMVDRLLARLKGGPETTSARPISLRPSRSDPDLTLPNSPPHLAQYYQPTKSTCPEHVLKVFRADQSFKYLSIYKETTAQNVVQLALQEFSMTGDGGSFDWALCETTVTNEGVIKQRRLADDTSRLAERLGLNSRYYLKNNNRQEPLVPDELAAEVLREAQIQLSHLNAHVLAAQLTLQDFALFASIEPTEYVDNMFGLDSRYGWPHLADFEQLVNKETWWVASELCREKSVFKRVKLIKKLIKVARHCRDLHNFHSSFAIVSGLDKPAIRRLHNTWEKVPSKHEKLLDEVRQLFDPSRNMSRYRQHLLRASLRPPVVPLLPVIKKDLTFIHEGNATCSDELINFEKLRMVAKEIRQMGKLAGAPYELGAIAGLNDTLLHMNTFYVGHSGLVPLVRKTGTLQTAPQPRKKAYEQALMVRKVKAYLETSNVITDEDELGRLSMEIEPPSVVSSVSSANPGRKRLPSPSPSSTSSTSNNSNHLRMAPKFGVESPQAVQKMLSLVQNSRIRPVLPFHLSPSASATNSIATSRDPVDLTAESSSVTTFVVDSSSSSHLHPSYHQSESKTLPSVGNHLGRRLRSMNSIDENGREIATMEKELSNSNLSDLDRCSLGSDDDSHKVSGSLYNCRNSIDSWSLSSGIEEGANELDLDVNNQLNREVENESFQFESFSNEISCDWNDFSDDGNFVYPTPDDIDDFLQSQQPPKVSLLTDWLVQFSYIVLFLFARLCEFLWKKGWLKSGGNVESERQKDFVPIFGGEESLFIRNIYRMGSDAVNRVVKTVPGTLMTIKDRVSNDFGWTYQYPGTESRVLNMGSYNYLGFAQNRGPCAEYARKAINQYGIGASSSRQHFGNFKSQQVLEDLVAEYLGVEAVICVPMGFNTNAMNIPAIVDKGCLVLSDQLNHASLVLGCRLSGAIVRIFEHNNIGDLERKLRDAIIYGQPNTYRPYKKIVIIVEGIYSMEGTICPLSAIIKLKKKYRAYLFIDEAHSIGALGKTGRGVCDYFGCNVKDIDILMGTMTKSFAAAGGYIGGSKKLIDYLRVHSHDGVYGTTMSPPIAMQIVSSMSIIMGKDGTDQGKRRIWRLMRNTHYFRKGLQKLGFLTYGHQDSPVVPFLMFYATKTLHFTRETLKRNLAIVGVCYPATPMTRSRARFCLSAGHTKEQLDWALQVCSQIADEGDSKYGLEQCRKWQDIEIEY